MSHKASRKTFLNFVASV